MKSKLIFSLLVMVFFSVSVFAVNTPEHASFTFKLNNSLSQGEWSLNIVPLGQYGNSQAIFEEFKNKYLEAKANCGLSSDFTYSTEINPDYAGPDPSRNTKGVLDSARAECDQYISFVGNPWNNHVIEFSSAHYNYVSKNYLGKGFYPENAQIVDNEFVFPFIGKWIIDNGPFIFVLEKLNSTDEIYFSDKVSIPWTQNGQVEFKSYDENNYIISLSMEPSSNHLLSISFPSWSEPSPKSTYLYYIIGIVIVVIILLVYLKLRK